MKGNDTLPNMDFGEWARAQARPFMGKHEQAQAEHEQARANFREFSGFGRLESDITDFVKNLWRELTHSKIWILGSEHGLGHGHWRASMSKQRLSTSKHEQILEFSDFGCFEPDITDFVKNL